MILEGYAFLLFPLSFFPLDQEILDLFCCEKQWFGFSGNIEFYPEDEIQ
jgi:hypothetical protein